MTYQLTNLTVVSGASSGIGAEIARRLAARKARLLLTGRDAGAPHGRRFPRPGRTGGRARGS